MPAEVVSCDFAVAEGEITREPSILLFAADPPAAQVAEALRREIVARVTVAGVQAICMEALRRQSFDLLLLEESVTALNPVTAEMLYEGAGTAVVVEVNFGLMQRERIVLAARSALRRRKLDLLQAGVAARLALQQQFTASLTGLYLESQLALRQAGPGQVPALERLVDLAEHVCAQLRAPDDRSL